MPNKFRVRKCLNKKSAMMDNISWNYVKYIKDSNGNLLKYLTSLKISLDHWNPLK